MALRVNSTEKTHAPDGSLTLSEQTRRHQVFLDSQPTTVRCSHCPDWSVETTAGEATAVAAAHRAEVHPEFAAQGRGRRKTKADHRREQNRLRAEREDAERLAKIERGRRLRGELEETAAPEMPVAVSSNDVDDTHHQEEPMPLQSTRPQTRDEIIAAVRRFVDENGRMPLPSDTADHDYLPHKQFHEKQYALDAGFPSWQSLWDHFDAGKIPQGRGAAKYKTIGTAATASTAATTKRRKTTKRKPRHSRVAPVAPPHVEPEPKPEPTVELEQRDAPPHASPLVRLLSQLTVTDLEDAVGELEHLQRRLQAEHALVTEALNHQAV